MRKVDEVTYQRTKSAVKVGLLSTVAIALTAVLTIVSRSLGRGGRHD